MLRPESTTSVEIPDWRKHGSATGGFWLDFDEPFFRVGTNPVSRAYVAASGSVSFESMQRPPFGAPLPDSSGRPALAPLLAPLGMVAEANWTNVGASSRFWHDEAPGRSRVFTWEDALLDRIPGRRVSVQAELHPSGDFTCRYAFLDALDPPATNLVLGAQAGTNGVNALAILGTNVLSAPVWRVDGTIAENGIPIADILCTNGVLRTPARFAIEWKNTSELDPNADTDSDGISDWDEVFRHGTNPHQSDTDYDGKSDGVEIAEGLSPSAYDMDDDGLVDGIDPHPLVFDGNGFGTSPLWVHCSFTNAEEILVEGYDRYVARITGDSPPNQRALRGGLRSSSSPYRRLYLLSASVAALPVGRRILIGVGDRRIVLDTEGTFLFSLEKGREYELVTDAPDLVSFECEHTNPVIVAPTWESSGKVFWRASGVEVFPSTHHFSTPGDQCSFEATCLDCLPAYATDWLWTSDCPDLVFETPQASNCIVRWTGDRIPWGAACFTVSCMNLGETVSAEVRVTFGTHTTPQTTLSLSAPNAFFVNDDDDDEDGVVDWNDDSVANDDDLVPLVIVLMQDDPSIGILTIEALPGASRCRAWTDSSKTSRLPFPIQMETTATRTQNATIYLEAGAPSGYMNGSRFRVMFSSPGENEPQTTMVSLTAVRLSRIEVPAAPATGLVVLRGTQVEMQLDVSPSGAASLLSTDWRLARRMSNGGYHAWNTIASSVFGRSWTYGFPNAGIYRMAADVELDGTYARTVHYLRNGAGLFDPDNTEAWNHIGVASTEAQISLREFAVEQLGRREFSYFSILPARDGFSSVPAEEWKCNAFVAFCANSVDQTVPVQHGRPPFSAYPPLANEWATGVPISGWSFLGIGIDPEPGWICGHPHQRGSGHVGVVDYDGYGIAAGTTNANRAYGRFLDGSCGYSKYGE